MATVWALYGKPGSGKSTLAAALGGPVIHATDVLRRHDRLTFSGAALYEGVTELLIADLDAACSGSSESVVLDGFPRTVEQQEALARWALVGGHRIVGLALRIDSSVATARQLTRPAKNGIADTAAHAAVAMQRWDIYERELLASAPWPIVPLDATGLPQELAARALRATSLDEGESGSEIRKAWDEGTWLRVGSPIGCGKRALCGGVPDAEWMPYEDYMRAWAPGAAAGVRCSVVVEFPPDGAEDNQLHTHPVSHRRICVLEGSGEFIAARNGTFLRQPLVAGDVVLMPKAVLHTFFSHGDGMTVESTHDPWVPLDDPRCLVYPRYAPRLDEILAGSV